MKILAQVEVRCKEHEIFDSTCAACCFVRKTEHDLQAVRSRRDSLCAQLKDRLRGKDLIIIDLK